MNWASVSRLTTLSLTYPKGDNMFSQIVCQVSPVAAFVQVAILFACVAMVTLAIEAFSN